LGEQYKSFNGRQNNERYWKRSIYFIGLYKGKVRPIARERSANMYINVKVKESHYRPEVPREFQEDKVQDFVTKAHDGGRL